MMQLLPNYNDKTFENGGFKIEWTELWTIYKLNHKLSITINKTGGKKNKPDSFQHHSPKGLKFYAT